MIEVLVVDDQAWSGPDSPTSSTIIDAQPDMTVVGHADDGFQAGSPIP